LLQPIVAEQQVTGAYQTDIAHQVNGRSGREAAIKTYRLICQQHDPLPDARPVIHPLWWVQRICSGDKPLNLEPSVDRFSALVKSHEC
jgi:hypothetical protein